VIPPLFPRFRLDLDRKRRKRKLKRPTKYKPTLTSKYLKFELPVRLTGLYHRPATSPFRKKKRRKPRRRRR